MDDHMRDTTLIFCCDLSGMFVSLLRLAVVVVDITVVVVAAAAAVMSSFADSCIHVQSLHSLVVEHVLCKHKAVGSIPAVSSHRPTDRPTDRLLFSTLPPSLPHSLKRTFLSPFFLL